MTRNSVEVDLAERVRNLERLVDDQLRVRTLVRPNLRDLADMAITQVTDGQVAVYRKATGKWHPVSIIPPFARDGALVLTTSLKWPFTASTRVRRMYGLLTTAGTTATTFRLLRNGSPVTGASVTIAASAFGGAAAFDVTFAGPEADYAQTEITAVGTGAAGLVVVYT